jgi:hypothetical protein
MKALAKLLYVESDEEVTDLIDRLRELDHEDAVTFVVPPRSRAFQSPMSFKLLKRYADTYGKRVNLISGEPRLQTLAAESGFSAYPTLEAYDRGGKEPAPAEAVAVAEPVGALVAGPARSQLMETRQSTVMSAPPKRQGPPPVSSVPGKQPMDRRPFYITAGIILLLALIAGTVLLPTAAVTVSVAGTPIKVDPQLMGAVGTAAGSPDHFATQALSVVETSTTTTSTTGQKAVAATLATGEVVFRDSCALFCGGTLREGIRVATKDGKRYETTAPIDFGQSRTHTAPIKALQDGAAGNTDKDTITVIENSTLAGRLSVNNPKPVGGGADAKNVPIVQQSDIDLTRDAILSLINPKVQQGMDTKAKGLKVVQLPPDTKVEADRKVGEEVSTFNVKVTVTSNAIGFDDATVKKMLREALKRMVPDNLQLTDTIKLTYEPDTATATADGHVTLKGHAGGYTVPRFSEAGMRAYIKGRGPSNAHAKLAALPSVVDVVIRQEPFALPWLPLFSSRISIKVQEVSGTATQ